MAFDISALDTAERATQGVRIVLKHPATRRPVKDEDGNEAAVTIAGVDSAQSRAFENEVATEQLETRLAGLDQAADIAQRNRIRRLIACTLKVENIMIGGEPVEVERRATLRKLYAVAWIAEQVEAAHYNRGLFLADASSDSPPSSSESSPAASA